MEKAQISTTHLPLIIFDGECLLCSGFVHRVVARSDTPYYFSDGSAPEVADFIAQHGLDRDSSIYLIDGDQNFYQKSEAARRIFPSMGGWEKAFVSFAELFPRAFQDKIYDLIARNRKRWQKKACPMPSEELRSLMLD